MIRFIVDYKNIVFNGEAQYLKDEYSFFYNPWNDVNFSVLIENGYNSLDVKLENGRVFQMTGKHILMAKQDGFALVIQTVIAKVKV